MRTLATGVLCLALGGPLAPFTAGQSQTLLFEDFEDGLAPGAAATLAAGLSQLAAPFKGGTLVPVPMLLIPMVTDGAGEASLPFVLPPALPAGVRLYFQYWIADPAASFGLSASNAVLGITS